MNVNSLVTMDYENKSDWTLGQNKPNSNPIKPNLQKAKMNINSIITKDYRKKDDFLVRINKPNFRNAKKLTQTLFHKRIMKMNRLPAQKNKPKTNPILERMNLNFCHPVATAENCMYHISSLEVTIGDD